MVIFTYNFEEGTKMIMLDLQRDELFERRRNNRKLYKDFCKRSMEVDEEYQKNFPKDEPNKIRAYNLAYEEKLRNLSFEKKNLDLEWTELNQQIQELIKQ